MAWIKRIFLFLAVNFTVMITLSILLNVLGVRPYLDQSGINYESLMAFCLVWGMGGAFISLLLSRAMAKWFMGVQVISPETTNPDERALLGTVYALAREAQLPVMPEVGVYDSPEVNAFATGPTKSHALVAVSSGLLQRLNDQEVKGVLGHEVAHVANGDMVTMTLIQGVVNAFVMFLARAIAFAISSSGRNDDNRSSVGASYYMVQFVLEMVFMLLGSMVVAWFSRYREYRADAGGAKLAGRQNMIGALQALRKTYELVDPSAQPAVQALKISSRPGGIMRLFSTHPPLEDRIARLQQGA